MQTKQFQYHTYHYQWKLIIELLYVNTVLSYFVKHIISQMRYV